MGQPETVSQAYSELAAQGAIENDPAQRELASALDRVLDNLARSRLQSKKNALGWLSARHREKDGPSGMYVHGGVGGGKTLLMDLFFATVPGGRKRRVHFQEFMQEVHARLHAHRQAHAAGKSRNRDPVAPTAAEISATCDLVCLDEFAVTDIADAMLLQRLFGALLERGLFVIATSNLAPEEQYRDGLNRQLFLPFVELLQRRLGVFRLANGTDYRLQARRRGQAYLTPLSERNEAAMGSIWSDLRGEAPVRSEQLRVHGRDVIVERAAGTAAWFTFAELCQQPRGAADYLAIAGRYSTIFLSGVPQMSEAQRNEAKRFILLVDTFYDRHIRMVICAEAHPHALYSGQRGNEALEFQRTASRLIEMQGEAWATRPAGDRSATAILAPSK